MKDYIFRVEGQPRGKGRPRFTKNGYAYTPESTRIYEEEIQLRYKEKYGDDKLDGNIAVEVFINKEPASYLGKKRYNELLGTYCNIKPDADNVVKAVLDALNGLAYDDDKNVVELYAQKRYATESSVVVRLYEVERNKEKNE